MIHFPILRSLCTNYPHFWKNQKRNLLLSLCTRRYQLTALNNDHCLVKSCDAQRTIPITKLASIFKLLIDVNGIKLLLINDVQTMIFCFFLIMLVCLSQLQRMYSKSILSFSFAVTHIHRRLTLAHQITTTQPCLPASFVICPF